jgi:HipA-like protein
MIKVWTSGAEAGLLDRFGQRGSVFAYSPDAGAERAVSLTMPVRLASWDTQFGLAPIFEMNLPEGALRERLRLAFAKATGSFDDLDMLAIVGRSQVGRLRYTGVDDALDEARFWPAAALAACSPISSTGSRPSPASAAYSPNSWFETRQPSPAPRLAIVRVSEAPPTS